jgi:hypothetical protein
MKDFAKYHLCYGYPYGNCDEMIPLNHHYCKIHRVLAMKEMKREAAHKHWYRKEHGHEEINHDDNYWNAIYAG